MPLVGNIYRKFRLWLSFGSLIESSSRKFSVWVAVEGTSSANIWLAWLGQITRRCELLNSGNEYPELVSGPLDGLGHRGDVVMGSGKGVSGPVVTHPWCALVFRWRGAFALQMWQSLCIVNTLLWESLLLSWLQACTRWPHDPATGLSKRSTPMTRKLGAHCSVVVSLLGSECASLPSFLRAGGIFCVFSGRS